MMSKRSRTASLVAGWVVLGVGSLLAGLIAQRTGLPAGWLVGPMLVALVVALVWEGHPAVPRWGRTASLAVVGGVLASAFDPSVLPLIFRHWLPVTLVVFGTLILSLGAGQLLSVLVHLDRKTAALGTLPGAASGMLAMSDPLGADARLVALMQYTRVVVVVVSATLVGRLGLVPGTASPQASSQGLQTTPGGADILIQGPLMSYALTALIAVLGAWAGTRFRLPAGALLGPLLLGVAIEELGVVQLAWPQGVPQAAYLVLGLWVGLLFDSASVKRAGRLLPVVLASAVGLVVACAALGWVLAAVTGIDGITAYLATTPGGIDSVAIVALGSGADAALVLAVQMLRLLAVVLAGSFLGWLWS
ncbi:MAG: AbrB family transcriptional regulator [Rubrobacteraceae bacterium]|nr:AbrB family transcriptional regulator [Rubrobacteraceae bacterium]